MVIIGNVQVEGMRWNADFDGPQTHDFSIYLKWDSWSYMLHGATCTFSITTTSASERRSGVSYQHFSAGTPPQDVKYMRKSLVCQAAA